MALAKYTYAVHGLVIGSELELPELAAIAPRADGAHDVNFHLAALPGTLETTATEIPDLSLSADGVVLSLPGAARFEVRRGAEVTIEVADDPDMALLRVYLFGSVMGLICHQRGILPLHASAVAFGDKAIAFCGPPGTGKSTLAACCVETGAQLVADDVLVISDQDSPRAMVNPGMPKLKLWRDALEVLGRTSEGLTPDWARAEKFHVPADELQVKQPVELSRVLVVEDDEDAGVGIMSALSGAEAVSALIENTYRPEYLDFAQRRRAHFSDCVRLTRRTSVMRLRRQRDRIQLMKTAAMLMDSAFAPP